MYKRIVCDEQLSPATVTSLRLPPFLSALFWAMKIPSFPNSTNVVYIHFPAFSPKWDVVWHPFLNTHVAATLTCVSLFFSMCLCYDCG